MLTLIGQGSIGGSPSINAAGTVALTAGLAGGGTGIFTGSGGVPMLIASNVSSQFTGFADPAINDKATVAFVAGTGAGQGVFSGQKGSFTLIADNSSQFDGFVNNRVALNSGGAVAFFATYPRGVGNHQGVFTGSGGALTTIALTGGQFASFSEGPSMNGLGEVAFIANLTSGSMGIYVGNGGPLTLVADTSGPYGLLSGASINDKGMIAFAARLQVGGSGIFIGPDPVADKVIASGDSVFGSTVLNVTGVAENEAGQIAFEATLSDGRTVLIRADPVPEPAGASLFGLGILGALCCTWRKGKHMRLFLSQLFQDRILRVCD
jgi:hypothetical protein